MADTSSFLPLVRSHLSGYGKAISTQHSHQGTPCAYHTIAFIRPTATTNRLMQNRSSFNARKTKKKLGEKTKNEYAHEEDSMLTGQR